MVSAMENTSMLHENVKNDIRFLCRKIRLSKETSGASNGIIIFDPNFSAGFLRRFKRAIAPVLCSNAFWLNLSVEFVDFMADSMGDITPLFEHSLKLALEQMQTPWLQSTPEDTNMVLEFLKRNAAKIDWKRVFYVSRGAIKKESIIRELAHAGHITKEGWDGICSWNTLSESFMEEFSEFLNWEQIADRQEMSESFMLKHIEKFSLEKLVFCRNIGFGDGNPYLLESFLDKLEEMGKLNEKLWGDIWYSQPVSEAFVKRHMDKIDNRGVDCILSNSKIKLSDEMLAKLLKRMAKAAK